MMEKMTISGKSFREEEKQRISLTEGRRFRIMLSKEKRVDSTCVLLLSFWVNGG